MTIWYRKSVFTLFTIGLLLVTLALNVSQWSYFFEIIYFRGFYQLLRLLLDHTFLRVNFPLVWIVLPFGIIATMWFVFFKKVEHEISPIICRVSRLVAVFCWVIILFYWLWGFNYQKKGLSPDGNFYTFSKEELYSEAVSVIEMINKLRVGISNSSAPLTLVDDYFQTESKVRQSIRQLISLWDIPVSGRVRAKALKPSGNLLRLSTLGIYMPFTGESYFDAGVSDLQVPFIMAHEMAHGYGFTDEGECNFLGIIACLRSDDTFIFYSGLLAYWRYLASAIKNHDIQMFEDLLSCRSELVRLDHEDILSCLNAYPELFTGLRDKIYDIFLRKHGIKEGMASYGTVVNRMMALRQGSKVSYGAVHIDSSELLDKMANPKNFE